MLLECLYGNAHNRSKINGLILMSALPGAMGRLNSLLVDLGAVMNSALPLNTDCDRRFTAMKLIQRSKTPSLQLKYFSQTSSATASKVQIVRQYEDVRTVVKFVRAKPGQAGFSPRAYR